MSELIARVDAHEGPVHVAAEQALYFTTQRAGRRVDIMRLSLADGRLTTVVADANAANGMALDRDGRLLVCEQQPAAIALIDPATGARESLVDAFRGRPLNSPNDVVVKSDGSIWFTDPSYAHLQGFGPPPQLGDHVYAYDGELELAAAGFEKPNGLAFSPDESVLYVGDSEACVIDAFDVLHGRVLANRRRFAAIERGYPDGLKTDARGNVYTTGGPGLLVYSPDGVLIREIDLPGAVNFAFTGDRLLVTTDDAIWAVETNPVPQGDLTMTIVRTRRIIDDAGAEAVLAAAERHALEQGHRVVMAVVDPWGELVQLRRTPAAQAASSRVAVDKARTAAIFVRPSREIEEQVTNGRLGALALHGASALTGGIPLTVDGEVVGAIGTSGETPDEDEAISLAGAGAEFSFTEVPALTYEGARLAAEAAGAEAARRGVAPVISAVDAGGALMYLVRPDHAQVASVEVTTDKARTAAIYRRPSKDFEDQASHGRPSALHLARAVPLQGGIPIEHDGQVIGAIGVSGATSADEDNELAQIGAQAIGAALATNGRGAAFFPAEAVVERFRSGGLLLDEPAYKIDAGRREAPGEAEYHEHTVDVMHVVDGSATVVLGGRLQQPREVAPGELRAPSVDGGERRKLRQGDVLAIPNRVAHQFVDVSDPFLYFVVKVAA